MLHVHDTVQMCVRTVWSTLLADAASRMWY